MDRATWKKILSRVYIEEVPDEFLAAITVNFRDGTRVRVASEDDLLNLVEQITDEELESNPIQGLEFGIDFRKVKLHVEEDLERLFNTIKGPE